jgi:hypothetical protein
VRTHVRDKHEGVGEVEKVPRKERVEEQSYAEFLIEGIIDGTMTEDGEYIG